MRPKTETLAPGACRLNVALAALEAVLGFVVLAVILREPADEPREQLRHAFAILWMLLLWAAAVVHATYGILARRGEAGPGLTAAALWVGLASIPWGPAVAIYTWMRLGDPNVESPVITR